VGATRFVVSNVLPYTKAMCEEALYPRVITRRLYSSSDAYLDLSALDGDQITYKSRRDVMRGGLRISLAGCDLADARNRCPLSNGARWRSPGMAASARACLSSTATSVTRGTRPYVATVRGRPGVGARPP